MELVLSGRTEALLRIFQRRPTRCCTRWTCPTRNSFTVKRRYPIPARAIRYIQWDWVVADRLHRYPPSRVSKSDRPRISIAFRASPQERFPMPHSFDFLISSISSFLFFIIFIFLIHFYPHQKIKKWKNKIKSIIQNSIILVINYYSFIVFFFVFFMSLWFWKIQIEMYFRLPDLICMQPDLLAVWVTAPVPVPVLPRKFDRIVPSICRLLIELFAMLGVATLLLYVSTYCIS